MLKKTITYFLSLSALASVVFLLSFSHERHSKKLVKKFNLTIENNHEHRFANEKNILDFISELQGPINNKSLDQISLSLIEKKLKQIDFVKDAQIYMEINGEIHLRVWQKEPIARIKIGSKSYYLTQEGVMNTCSWYTPEVILVEGIFFKTDIKILKEMIQYVNNDELLKNQIIGIKKISSKLFNLIPKKGDYVIELGDLSNYEDKLERFKALYKQYTMLLESAVYKKIHLQYSGQVVATKI